MIGCPLFAPSGHFENNFFNLFDWELPTLPQGYGLGPCEGEHLIQRGGDIFIDVDPVKGSNSLAMGTQQILVGVGIPIHRHLEMDEAFYIIEGRGTFILDDARHPIEKGASIFIPKNAWHGFENADSELVLLWLVAPPGLECFPRNSYPTRRITNTANKGAVE